MISIDLNENIITALDEEGFKCKPLRGITMRRTTVIALLLVAMLLVPAQAGDVSAQQEQAEDPKQPNANNTTMYLYHDGFADAWSHFSTNDTDSSAEGEYREEKDNGVIDVNLRFRMKPDLDKRLLRPKTVSSVGTSNSTLAAIGPTATTTDRATTTARTSTSPSSEAVPRSGPTSSRAYSRANKTYRLPSP